MKKTDYEQQLNQLLLATNALMLSTVNGEGFPEASYAPYVELDGSFYIFISELASHTTNLKRLGIVSVLFMENDHDGNAFTRQRLTCHCKATAIERENILFESAMQQMEKQFGNLIATLKGLNDFQLFQLNPIKGNFVAGFGQAFEVDFPLGKTLRHRRPD